MKKPFLNNMIIVLILILLIIPYNFFFRYFASQLNTFAYIAVIAYAFLFGVSLIMMDYSNRKINLFFTAFYLAYSLIEIQYSFFQYGPTVYLLVLMLGAFFMSVIKRR